MEQMCPGCGAKYILQKTHLGYRDKDSEECKYCGFVLYSWNEGNMYSAVYLSVPTKKYKTKTTDTH